MRPAEIALCCLTLAASAALLAGLPFAWSVTVAFLAVLCITNFIHSVGEGVHWQMAPLYLAVIIAGLSATWAAVHAPWNPPWIERLTLGAAILFLSLMAVGLSCLLPMFRLPKPSGPHSVATRILYMVDPKRDAEGGLRGNSKRELMVQVWYPAEPVKARREVYRRFLETTLKSSYQSVLRTQSLREAPVLAVGAPYPLLIFNPAWTGQRTQSTFLMQDLASHGFVVASVDHSYYSGLVAFPDGHVVDSHMAPALGDFTHLTIEEGIDLANQFVTILAEDVIFVLDELTRLNEKPESEWYGVIDGSCVGVLGHSIGGAVAAEACWLDPRIKCALNLDGWTFGEVLRHGLAKPWMVIYGKGIEVEPPNLEAQPEGIQRYWQMNRLNYAVVAAALRKNGGHCLSIKGASHWNFSDRPLYSPLRSQTQAGTIPPERAHRIIAELARAFFDESLKGEGTGSVAEAARPYPEVEINSTG